VVVFRNFVLALAVATCAPVLAGEVITQNLPITAQVRLNKQLIDLEVAATPQEQAIGLMGRKDLSPNRGMLFPFDPPRFTAFWMANCLIPLDMIFIYKGKIVHFAPNAEPCKAKDLTQCPTYPSKVPIDQVLELKAGQIQTLKLKINDPVPVNFLKAS